MKTLKKKNTSMHRRLGSATLSQLTFPGESNTKLPWDLFQWDNAEVCKIRTQDIHTDVRAHTLLERRRERDRGREREKEKGGGGG